MKLVERKRNGLSGDKYSYTPGSEAQNVNIEHPSSVQCLSRHFDVYYLGFSTDMT